MDFWRRAKPGFEPGKNIIRDGVRAEPSQAEQSQITGDHTFKILDCFSFYQEQFV